MRILMAHNYYQHRGGEDESFEAEARLLESRGHELIRYLRHSDEIEGRSLPAVAAASIWSRRSRRELRRLLREIRPDIVHFQNTFPLISPSAYSPAREVGIPVVQSLRNYRLVCLNGTLFRDGGVCEDCLHRQVAWPGVLHACYRDDRMASVAVASMLVTHRLLKTWTDQVDCYIANTMLVRDKLVSAGLPLGKVSVKPNFVDPDPGTRIGDGDYALFAGRLSPEKGLTTLLRAWKIFDRGRLLLAGDGPMRADYERYVERQEIAGVEFLGRMPHDEMPALIKGARVVIFPSEWYETFGRIVAESFACGVPVIASRLGVMEDLIVEGRTGQLFEPGQAEELAGKLRSVWDHPEKWVRMGFEARREYEAKYTAERNYAMLMEIYERARTPSTLTRIEHHPTAFPRGNGQGEGH
jgi:glycosyltransferase involved in cell wall biosynthesis